MGRGPPSASTPDRGPGHGWIRGAALDVLERNRCPPDHPLWRHPRALITPHVAGATARRGAQAPGAGGQRARFAADAADQRGGQDAIGSDADSRHPAAVTVERVARRSRSPCPRCGTSRSQAAKCRPGTPGPSGCWSSDGLGGSTGGEANGPSPPDVRDDRVHRVDVDAYLVARRHGSPLWDLDRLVRACDRTRSVAAGHLMPLARAPLDVAWHDALGRSRGVSLGRLWGRRRHESVELWLDRHGRRSARSRSPSPRAGPHGYRHFQSKTALGVRTGTSPPRSPGWRPYGRPPRDARLIVDANQDGTQDSALRSPACWKPLDVAAPRTPLPPTHRGTAPLRTSVRSRSPWTRACATRATSPLRPQGGHSDRGGQGAALRRPHPGAAASGQLAEDCGVALMGRG
ncbi:NAD(P)-dependent oxidoreductase [Streptomyces echinatus]|uniref:NAD(P)-dependent oxidoreductase n=1 Tax=Streptomyces echinatus TaxID=67293 RepID=UPI0031F1A41B